MSSPGKEFHIDAVYPEHLSRLRRTPKSELLTSPAHRRPVKKQLRKVNSGRFRTQPVTFHEIKEVDEENEIEELSGTGSTNAVTTETVGSTCKSESDLKTKFELFYKSITGDLSGSESLEETTKSTPSPVKNTPASSVLPIVTKPSDDALLSSFNPRSRPSL